MSDIVNVSRLRTSLPRIVARVHRGDSLTVTYRGRPAFRIVPAPFGVDAKPMVPLDADPLYRAGGLGRSTRRSSIRAQRLLP